MNGKTLKNPICKQYGFDPIAFLIDSNGSQIPAIQEAGHMLGLQHPGQYLKKPSKPNSLPDYTADRGSLMGLGMTLREANFDRAFCDHIEFNNQNCSLWRARNK